MRLTSSANPKLATLAVQVRLTHQHISSATVQAMDAMIAQSLKRCVDEFNTNQLQTERQEREKDDLIAKIEDLLRDDDQARSITFAEVQDAGLKWMSVTRMETIEELFEIPDADGSGEINVDGFCEGMMRFATTEQPSEFIQMLKQMQIMPVGLQALKFGQVHILELHAAKINHLKKTLKAALEVSLCTGYWQTTRPCWR